MCGRGGSFPTCDATGTAVTGIVLPGVGMAGPLPAVISAWTALKTFAVHGNPGESRTRTLPILRVPRTAPRGSED